MQEPVGAAHVLATGLKVAPCNRQLGQAGFPSIVHCGSLKLTLCIMPLNYAAKALLLGTFLPSLVNSGTRQKANAPISVLPIQDTGPSTCLLLNLEILMGCCSVTDLLCLNFTGGWNCGLTDTGCYCPQCITISILSLLIP